MATDVQVFDYMAADQTWVKPTGAVAVRVVVIGAGGGAGGGASAVSQNRSGGGGGGGGAIAVGYFDAAALEDEVLVVVGAGGPGGAGGPAGAAQLGSAGTDGENSSFGTHLIVGGGQRGLGGQTLTVTGVAGGGVGGGHSAFNSTAADALSGQGAQTNSATAFNSESGGACGAGSTTGGAGNAGGSSLYGGPGGGGGGGVTSGNVGNNGAAGGANGAYTVGGGGTAGTGGGTPSGGGDGGTPVLYCGQGGGGGGGGSAAVAGMNGGAGGIGAGGGGGGTGSNSASSSNAGGSGGAGGDGRVIVITYGGTSDTPNVYLHDATDNFTVFFSLSNPDLTVTLPDYAADDVVVLHCATWDTGTTGFGITTPSGWTLLDTPPISTKRGPWVFYRVMDGTEGTTVTLQGSGYVASTNSQKECRATCWRTDVVGGTISLDGSAVVTSATATGDPATATTGTVTTSDLDETVLACMYGDNNALTEFDMTVTTSNWFRRYEDYGGGSSGLWVGLVTKRQLTAASITLSADLDGGAATSDNWRIVAFALMVSPPAVGSFQAIMI